MTGRFAVEHGGPAEVFEQRQAKTDGVGARHEVRDTPAKRMGTFEVMVFQHQTVQTPEKREPADTKTRNVAADDLDLRGFERPLIGGGAGANGNREP